MKKFRNDKKAVQLLNDNAASESFYKRTHDLNVLKSGQKWCTKQIHHQKGIELGLHAFKSKLSMPKVKYFYRESNKDLFKELECLRVVGFSKKNVIVEGGIFEYGTLVKVVRLNFNEIYYRAEA